MPSPQYQIRFPLPTYGDGVAGLEVHPEARTLVVGLEADLGIAAPIGHWRAQLVYPGREIAFDLGREGPLEDLVLAYAKFAVVSLRQCEFEGANPAQVLRSEGEDLAAFGRFFRHGSLAIDVDVDVDDGPGGLLIVDKVWAPEPFRGRRFGLLLVAAVLRELMPCRLAVCKPAAFEVSPSSPERAAADERARRVWERFGFRPYKQDLLYLATDLVAVEEKARRFSMEVDAARPVRLP